MPHSDIHGSKPARGSPWLFAACHVLHRLLAPRHPPNALLMLEIANPSCNELSTMHRNHPRSKTPKIDAAHRKPSLRTLLSVSLSFSFSLHAPPTLVRGQHALPTPLNTRHATAGRRPSRDSSSGQTCARIAELPPNPKIEQLSRAPRDAPEPDSPF